MVGCCASRLPSLRALAVICLAVLASACATTTDASSPFVMGSIASAPAGLLELCDNGGLDCPDTADAGLGERPAATGGGAKSLDRPDPAEAHHVSDPAQPDPSSGTRVDFARFGEVEQVNRSINQQLIWRSDLDQYGIEEFWAFPIQAGLRFGDCEDFALEKRRVLIERGFPPAALALATAYSEETGLHAVLIVRTSQGDYVLDNTTPWVMPWRQTGYRWLTIQAGESLTDWRLVSDISDSQSVAAGPSEI